MVLVAMRFYIVPTRALGELMGRIGDARWKLSGWRLMRQWAWMGREGLNRWTKGTW